jgi:pre-rRNA-processing protein TSR2
MELRSGSVVGQEKPTSSSASSTVVGRLTNEAIAVLGEGIRLCFLRWTALQLAVENEWGGHTSKLKAQQLQSDVLSWFTRSKGPRYIDELENLLDENLVELFNTTADDGSVEEVCDPTKILSTHSRYSLDPQENWVSMTMQFWS